MTAIITYVPGIMFKVFNGPTMEEIQTKNKSNKIGNNECLEINIHLYKDMSDVEGFFEHHLST